MVLKLADLMKPEDFISRHLRWTRDPMEMRRIKTRRDEIYAEILAEDPDGGALALLDGVLPFLTLLQNNKAGDGAGTHSEPSITTLTLKP
jgi:hypothetical protein